MLLFSIVGGLISVIYIIVCVIKAQYVEFETTFDENRIECGHGAVLDNERLQAESKIMSSH